MINRANNVNTPWHWVFCWWFFFIWWRVAFRSKTQSRKMVWQKFMNIFLLSCLSLSLYSFRLGLLSETTEYPWMFHSMLIDLFENLYLFLIRIRKESLIENLNFFFLLSIFGINFILDAPRKNLHNIKIYLKEKIKKNQRNGYSMNTKNYFWKKKKNFIQNKLKRFVMKEE